MMNDLFTFLLKSAICSALLFGYYLLVLKNKKMNNFNRWYLVSSAVISVLLPLLHIDLVQVSQQSAQSFPILEVMGSSATKEQEVLTGASSINWTDLAVYGYVLVAVIMLVTAVTRIGWIYAMRRKYGALQMNGYWLVNTSLNSAPFSFGNTLYWKDGIDMNSREGSNILAHELTHIRQRHTADKLLLQLLITCCWLNPFFWMIRKELWLQHEFIADDHAIEDGDTDAFARMLLQAQIDIEQLPVIVNSFFYSPIKRRLMMLTQNSKTTYARMRRLLVAPLLMLTVFIFSFTIDKKADTVRASKKMTIVLDAAHGGKDNGGVGLNGIYEKDITLRVSRMMMSLAAEYNIDVIPTREDDAYPTLQQRIDISNAAQADLFVSLHVNKNPEGSALTKEYEVGVCTRADNYAKSLKLASALMPRLKAAQVDAKLVEKSSMLVLRENKHSAVFIELGNLEDAANLARLADDTKLEEICRSILAGIVDYGASR